MKSNGHPSLYFSPHSPKSQKQEPLAKPSHQSPYLRAILSEKTISRPGRLLSMNNDSSMAAALRYITHNK
jgi:hypothetical protein